jgi:signal transduction histidine kinase
MSDNTRRLVTAVHHATLKLAETASVNETLKEVLQICVEASGAFGGTIYIYDQSTNSLIFHHVLPDAIRDKLPFQNIPSDFGIAGEVFQSCKPKFSIFDEDESLNPIEEATSIRVQNMLTVPLMIEERQPLGIVQLINKKGGEFDQSDLEVLETVCSVSAMAYENSLLTEQATRAASLLGMGKVSHDIGNLTASVQAGLYSLESVIFSENEHLNNSDVQILKDEIEYMRDSVSALVGYSRLISNLSAGKPITPEFKKGDISAVISKAATMQESEARRGGIRMVYELEDSEEETEFDPQFVARIVQNLVGNAIRALKENPQKSESKPKCIITSYKRLPDSHVISVKDNGPGMSEEVARRIMEGTASSAWSKSVGSGWGTKIVKELTTSHGGFFELDSKLGEGSEFRVILPVNAKPKD